MKKKIATTIAIPEFQDAIDHLPRDEQVFVDRSMEIAHYIAQLMASRDMLQKDLAASLGKSEAEVSKWLSGLHNFTLRSLVKLEVALNAPVICVPYQVPVKRPVMNNYLSLGQVEVEAAKKDNYKVDYYPRAA